MFAETFSRHSELRTGIRWILERRIRAWRTIHGAEYEVICWQFLALQTFQDLDQLDRAIQAASMTSTPSDNPQRVQPYDSLLKFRSGSAGRNT